MNIQQDLFTPKNDKNTVSPKTPKNGDTYMDATDFILYTWNGEKWVKYYTTCAPVKHV